MATGGAKPKPAALRLVDGSRNVTRHGSEDDLRKKAQVGQQAFGKLAKPKHLTGEAAKIWKQLIEPANWLDGSRLASAVAFCELWEEFRDDPRSFIAGKHGQMRAYMSELGLTDERNRGDVAGDGGDDFFD